MEWAGWLVLQLIGRTSRLTRHWAPSARALDASGGPIVFAFWHRFQLLMVWEHRHRGVTVLVSRSRDGEFIARVLERFGFRTARGSSSRGGPAAFRALRTVVESGGRVAFTPDGPRGPAESVQPGVIALAEQTGAPIVPVAWAGTRVKTLRSWDRFQVPLPFGRFVVAFGDPVRIAPGVDGAAALRAALIQTERIARERLAC